VVGIFVREISLEGLRINFLLEVSDALWLTHLHWVVLGCRVIKIIVVHCRERDGGCIIRELLFAEILFEFGFVGKIFGFGL
jgi:hypothetical protein